MGFKPGTTDLPELITGKLTITKSTTSATSTSSNEFTATQNVRAGSIAVTMDTGDTIAANTGWMVATITCDKVLAADTIICSAVNCHDGSSTINASLSAFPIAIDAGNFFKVYIKQQSSTTVPEDGGFTLNWAIV